VIVVDRRPGDGAHDEALVEGFTGQRDDLRGVGLWVAQHHQERAIRTQFRDLADQLVQALLAAVQGGDREQNRPVADESQAAAQRLAVEHRQP
jgi:hypothetical protein